MEFRIQEPNRELTEGYLTFIIKCSVVFFLAWMVGILIIFTYPCLAWEGEKYPATLKFLNQYDIVNWCLVIVSFFFYFKHEFKKFSLGFITDIHFDEQNNLIYLEKINTLNGKITTKTFQKNELKITFELKQSSFLGKQHIFYFYQKESLFSSINIELSAWKRHPEIEELMNRLKLLEVRQ